MIKYCPKGVGKNSRTSILFYNYIYCLGQYYCEIVSADNIFYEIMSERHYFKGDKSLCYNLTSEQ